MRKVDNLINTKISFLTIISEASPTYYLNSRGYKTRVRFWNCTCDCGKTIKIAHGDLFRKSRKIKSCGCQRKDAILKAIDYYNKDKPIVELALMRVYKDNTKQKGCKRDFKLSLEEFCKIVNSKCHYCGSLPFTLRTTQSKSKSKLLNGIDRVDSSKGYTIDNVVPCCVHCNRAKMDRSLEDFRNWVKVVYKNLYSD